MLNLISLISAKLQKIYLNYSLVTAVWMMEPKERYIINAIVTIMLATMMYSSWVYLPLYTLKMLNFIGILSNDLPEEEQTAEEASLYLRSSEL